MINLIGFRSRDLCRFYSRIRGDTVHSMGHGYGGHMELQVGFGWIDFRNFGFVVSWVVSAEDLAGFGMFWAGAVGKRWKKCDASSGFALMVPASPAALW